MAARAPAGTGLFLLLWPMVGFILGLATLFGPVIWITGTGRNAGWSQSAEDAVVVLVILLLAAASLAVTAWLARSAIRSRHAHVRWGIPACVVLIAAGSVRLSLSPSLMAGLGGVDRVGARFTIGPYPDAEALARLKQEGYTGVISLLHPAVVPFEPRLLAAEEEAAAKVGIDLIRLPMLPWVSGNEAALRHLEEIAAAPGGRYYVHCYLGRDRVSLARRALEGSGGAVAPAPAAERSLESKGTFERGEIVRLDDGVWMTPYPTDEEFLTYFGTGRVAQVVSLLDPDNDEDRLWIEKERAILARLGIPLESLPVPVPGFDPQRVLDAARRAWTLPRPLVVHAFLAPSSGKSPAAEAFMQAFLAGRPPLPPSLFRAPLEGGPVTLIAPDIAAGPRPTPAEFGGVLARQGVREFVWVGDATDSAARADSAITAEHDLIWCAWNTEVAARVERVGSGGPWYLYGPDVDRIAGGLARRHGPAVPTRVTWDAGSWVRGQRLRDAIAHRLAIADWIVHAIPDLRLTVLLGPVLLLAAALAAAFAGHMRMRRAMKAPYTRKIFHFTIFTLAAFVHATAGLPGVVLFGAIVSALVIYAVLRGPGFPFYEAMARPTDAPRATLFIVVPLVTTALGGLLGNLLFAPFAFVGYLVGGWGDAVGEPVGTAWGRHRYRVPSLAGVPATRSLEGTAAVLAVGALAASVGLWIFGVPSGAAVAVGLACGAAGALVEAFSSHGLDNLTIQVAAAGTAFLLLAG